MKKKKKRRGRTRRRRRRRAEKYMGLLDTYMSRSIFKKGLARGSKATRRRGRN